MNSYIGGVNLVVAAAMVILGLIFLVRIWQGGPLDRVRAFFLRGMGLGYVGLALDYGITAALRIEESMVMPSSATAPTLLVLLAVVRTALAVILWAVIFYTLFRSPLPEALGEGDEQESTEREGGEDDNQDKPAPEYDPSR